jgi:DinB superfamily
VNYQIIKKPNPTEYDPYFQRYTELVPEESVIKTLENQLNEALSIYKGLDNTKIDYRYADGKWSIKELIIHILDTERIFIYRALRIARKDKTPMAGFEQDDYIENLNWDNYPFSSVLNEYELIRKHTILFFNSMTAEMLEQTGISSDMKMAVSAIPFIIAGHERHHLNILKSRYL